MLSHPLTPAAHAGVATRTGSDEPSLLLCNYKHDPLLPGNNTSALVHTAKRPPRAQGRLHSSKSFFHTLITARSVKLSLLQGETGARREYIPFVTADLSLLPASLSPELPGTV